MKTVLIIDDFERFANLCSRMLEKCGYIPRIAPSGADALQMLSDDVPDLILLDIMMEPMDGWETLEQIRKDPRLSDIPVIMMTAKVLLPDDILTHADSISGYIMKPITRERLEGAIAHLRESEEEIHNALCDVRDDTDEAFIEEYVNLRRQIRVSSDMAGILEKQFFPQAYERSECDEFVAEFDAIKTAIEDRQSRLREIESAIFPV